MRVYPRFEHRGRAYVVGDVHGRADLLEATFSAIDNDRAGTPQVVFPHFDFEIYLGDFVDRGPHSCQTLDRLIERSKQRQCCFIRGNHEQLFRKVLDGQETIESWLRIGGAETIYSYGLDPTSLIRGNAVDALAELRQAVPEAHRRFLGQLTNWLWLPPYFFTHAASGLVFPWISSIRRT